MSNRKNYNSIVFLTVYLGLVLVGGNAQVLANAATPRLFDIKTEIEFKDDLDTKPKNDEDETDEDHDFITLFSQLLKDVQLNVEKGEIPQPLQTNFKVETTFEKLEFTGGGGTGSNISEAKLNQLFQNALVSSFLPEASESADYVGKVKKGKIAFEANADSITLKVSFSKNKAQAFAEYLSQKYAESGVSQTDVLIKQLYENTQITSENDQVFIVTRLPRGSIDLLLAKDAQ
jgi:hypothetical protein